MLLLGGSQCGWSNGRILTAGHAFTSPGLWQGEGVPRVRVTDHLSVVSGHHNGRISRVESRMEGNDTTAPADTTRSEANLSVYERKCSPTLHCWGRGDL